MSNRLVSRCLKFFEKMHALHPNITMHDKCAAHYENNSYVFVCAKGYTGKYCETGSVLCVMGNRTGLEK